MFKCFSVFSSVRGTATQLADCTGHVFGIGDINDCFHDSGNKPASNERLSNSVTGYASSSENSLNTRLRIPSGPAALETLIFSNLDLTS